MPAGLACLTDIAVSSSEVETTFVSMIGDVLSDRLWIEMGFASVVMVLGWWYSPNRELKYWLILSALGIILGAVNINPSLVSFSRIDSPNVSVVDTGVG